MDFKIKINDAQFSGRPTLNGQTERLRNRPVALQSRSQRAKAHTALSSPFAEAECLSVICEQYVKARIQCLLCACRPSTIFRRIAEFVVDTLNRMNGGGARSHITVEVAEVSPSLVEFYTACAVKSVIRVVGICATAADAIPDSIFGALRKTVLSFLVCAEASARFSVQGSQVTVTNEHYSPAVASTLNRPISLLLGNAARSDKSRKSCSGGYIDSSWHDVLLDREYVLVRLAQVFTAPARAVCILAR